MWNALVHVFYYTHIFYEVNRFSKVCKKPIYFKNFF